MPQIALYGPDWSAAIRVIGELPAAVRVAREREGLTVKQQAAAVGVSPATLTRLDVPGTNSTEATLLRCLAYLAKGTL